MKKTRLARHSYSLMKIMKRLALLAIPLIILNIVISSLSILTIRRQNMESISDSVSLFQSETSDKIKAIQHFIQWSVVNEPLIETIETSDDFGTRSAAVSAFRTRVSDSQYATGTEYQYFLYLDQQDLFFNASKLQFSYQNYLQMKVFLLEQIKTGASIRQNSTWQSYWLDGTPYLYYLITYQDRTFVTLIRVEDLIAPLSSINLGKNGSLRLTDLNGQSLINPDELLNSKKLQTDSPFYSVLHFPGKKHSLPFQIDLSVDHFSNYGGLFLLQLFVILVALALCLLLSGLIFYMYRKVIRPIHEFSESLSSVNEQEGLINLQSSNIKELEQTNQQFKNLIREIKKLKINIYEKELDQKRFQIAFLQNQIRPHFYLNCLTTISSMAQLERYQDIESMVLFTSRYLRYLFQTDKEQVQIQYELQHIEAYLDIQSLRYGPVFQYHCQIEESQKSALIPPLFLITFIENTIKHSIAPDGQLQITLLVSKCLLQEKEYLRIELFDSGQGFPEEVLNRLEHSESPNDDNILHIGIQNNIQRLALLYEKDYDIKFSNLTTGGAHISIRLPYQV